MFLSVSVVTMVMTPFIFRSAPRVAFSAGFAQLSQLDLVSAPKGIIRIIRDATSADRAAAVDSRTKAARDLQNGASHHLSSHSIVIGFGVAGQNVAAAFRSLEIPYRIIEQNFEMVQDHQKRGQPISYGDASRDEILEHAGIETAKLVVVAVSGVQMTEAIVKAVRHHRPTSIL